MEKEVKISKKMLISGAIISIAVFLLLIFFLLSNVKQTSDYYDYNRGSYEVDVELLADNDLLASTRVIRILKGVLNIFSGLFVIFMFGALAFEVLKLSNCKEDEKKRKEKKRKEEIKSKIQVLAFFFFSMAGLHIALQLLTVLM